MRAATPQMEYRGDLYIASLGRLQQFDRGNRPMRLWSQYRLADNLKVLRSWKRHGCGNYKTSAPWRLLLLAYSGILAGGSFGKTLLRRTFCAMHMNTDILFHTEIETIWTVFFHGTYVPIVYTPDHSVAVPKKKRKWTDIGNIDIIPTYNRKYQTARI